MMQAPLRHKADVDPADSNPFEVASRQQDRDAMTLVRMGLKRGRTRLAFQPVVMATDTKRVGFHEGLIRILDPQGRPIPARDFMSKVETDELGRKIDCASLSTGISVLREHPEQRISVNMSARSVGYNPWLRVLRSAISDDPKLAERLILEISEDSAMLVPDLLMSFIREWRSKGVSFALDDYGSGQLSIPLLVDFGFDIVKIDGRFIRGLHKDARKQKITAALLAVAKQFDILSVAEMVESSCEAEYMAALGVDLLQGYAFGAPTVEPKWFTRFARKQLLDHA